MTGSHDVGAGTFSHDLLLHEGLDERLVESTREFVQQGLESGGRVLVHGDAQRVALFQSLLGSPDGLTYGVDRRELYTSPMRTLFDYQESLSGVDPLDVWATGPVPLSGDQDQDGAWLRYESAVNDALGPYPFHGLCTYDTASLPESAIAAARASHPHVVDESGRAASPHYLPPADFLAGRLAAVPATPAVEPTMTTILDSPGQLAGARQLLKGTASTSMLPGELVDAFVAAVNEVAVNGLVHGLSTVEVRTWAGPGSLCCEVSDDGPGVTDRLLGLAPRPGSSPTGLWVARRLCDELIMADRPEGGTRVRLVTAR